MATVPSFPCAYWGKCAGSPVGALIEARPVAPETGLRAPVPGNPVRVYGDDGTFGGGGGFEQKLVAQGQIANGQHLYFTVNGAAALVRQPGGAWMLSIAWQTGESVEVELRVL